MSSIRWDPFREFERRSGQAGRVQPRRIGRRPGVEHDDAYADGPPPDVRDLDTTVRLTVIAPSVLWRDWHW
jgi:hypothetical protein